MENASKALLMAAGVLMGVLILSLAVYLFTTLNASANENYNQMKTSEIAQFNSYYLSYNGRNDLTYYEVISIVKKARDFNASDEGKNEPIRLYISGDTSSVEVTKKSIDINDLKITLGEEPINLGAGSGIGDTYISEKRNGLVLRKFNCTVKFNSSERVNEIRFKRVPKSES